MTIKPYRTSYKKLLSFFDSNTTIVQSNILITTSKRDSTKWDSKDYNSIKVITVESASSSVTIRQTRIALTLAFTILTGEITRLLFWHSILKERCIIKAKKPFLITKIARLKDLRLLAKNTFPVVWNPKLEVSFWKVKKWMIRLGETWGQKNFIS